MGNNNATICRKKWCITPTSKGQLCSECQKELEYRRGIARDICVQALITQIDNLVGIESEDDKVFQMISDAARNISKLAPYNLEDIMDLDS